MSFRFVCPFCNQSYECDDELAGKVLKCSNCGQEIVPVQEEEAKIVAPPPIEKKTAQKKVEEEPKKGEKKPEPAKKPKQNTQHNEDNDIVQSVKQKDTMEFKIYSFVDVTASVIFVLNCVGCIPLILFLIAFGHTLFIIAILVEFGFVWLSLSILKKFFYLLCKISKNAEVVANYIQQQNRGR